MFSEPPEWATEPIDPRFYNDPNREPSAPSGGNGRGFREEARKTEPRSGGDRDPGARPNTSEDLSDYVLPVDDFLRVQLPERRNIVSPWLKEASYGMLVAPRGFGKTWFAMSLADAVSQEKDFGLWKTETAVDTLYLEGEMAARDVQERFKSLCADSKRARKLIIYSEGFANSMGYPRASLLDQAWRKRMADFLLRQGVKFWVVDNLSSLTPGIDENSKQDFDPVNQWFLNLRFQGISSLVLHHTGKNQDQRGTSGREDNVDYSIILQRPSGYLPEEGAKFIVHFTKARVEHKHLAGISDTEFSMVQDAEGRTRWSFTKIKPSNTKEVIRMLSEGVPYRDVTSALGVSLGVVTKIKKQAIKDRYLTHDGKLTQAGFIFISQ